MDDRAFEAIVERHHGEILRYLLRVTARGSEADDLVQETFLRAYRAWRTLGEDANVRAWLFAIATNLLKNHFRNEHRRRIAHAGVRLASREESDGAGPEDAALYNEARDLLDATIRTLPLKQRAAFVLRKVHDLDYREIGRSLDCSPDSARAHVFQALRKIRQSLNGHPLPEGAG